MYRDDLRLVTEPCRGVVELRIRGEDRDAAEHHKLSMDKITTGVRRQHNTN